MKKPDESFSIASRIKSFVYAFDGLKYLFRYEHNTRIHLAAAILAVIAGFIFHLGKTEWCLIILCIATVFFSEIINTAIEILCNVVQPSYHEKIKVVKDICAAGVTIAALMAAVIGCIIFLPKIISVL
jgi:diacylglycerol kinase (ATP)